MLQVAAQLGLKVRQTRTSQPAAPHRHLHLTGTCTSQVALRRATPAARSLFITQQPSHVVSVSSHALLSSLTLLSASASQVVGIGGKAVADGSTKLTLAIAWQLMHADATRFLRSLAMDERDILCWANYRSASQPCCLMHAA